MLFFTGQLLNSNLVMFDRATDSYFSQIAATGLTGPHRGETLDEVNLIWTTWDKWRAAHPDTKVLSEDTDYLRNYNDDPYGRYNPIGGYYQARNVLFPLLHESDRHHSKEMVVGARSSDNSAYFVLSTLKDKRVLTTDSFLAVYDAAREAIGRARDRNGPTLLEIQVHRRMGHFMGDPETYRPDEDQAAAAGRDSIERLADDLRAAGVDDASIGDLRERAEARVEEAIEWAKEQSKPDPAAAHEDMWTNPGSGVTDTEPDFDLAGGDD